MLILRPVPSSVAPARRAVRWTWRGPPLRRAAATTCRNSWPRSSASTLERPDEIARPHETALEDDAVEPGAIEKRLEHGPPEQVLEILARDVEAPALEHDRGADAEAVADEVVERHAAGRKVPPALLRRDL